MTKTNPKDIVRIRAGARALVELRSDGLNAARIGFVPGAAGGPKAVGLLGLDQAIFPWLAAAPRRRELIGASIGAWRMVCALQNDASAAFARLAERYTATSYPSADVAAITAETRAMLRDVYGATPGQTLAHPDYRLSILIAASHGLMNRDGRLPLAAGLATTAALNALARPLIGRMLTRVVCHDPRDTPCFLPDDGIPTRTLALTRDNLSEVMLASAAIPGVIEGIRLDAVPGRLMRDGGLTDYHLDLPFAGHGDLVLYPHFTDRIVPGWFDKFLPWRHADPQRQADTIVVSPAPAYLAKLGLGRLPDRRDFRRFAGRDAERQRLWRAAAAESQRLGDTFLQLVASGEIAAIAEPLFAAQ
jgi:hypothetical protein